MNCNSVKERMVDFLYEELPTDSRAAFEAHLRDCSACKAEVASYRTTLGSARTALTGALAQEPPARVHLAVMAAAKAAARSRSAARTPSRDTREAGFFARLWRAPWLMPALGAASVATVVFLVRVLKNPEVIPGQRPAPISELAEPSLTREQVAPPPELHAKAGGAKSERAAAERLPSAKGGVDKSRGVPRDLPRTRKSEEKGSAEGVSGAVRIDRDVLGSMDKATAPAATKKKMDRIVASDSFDELGALQEAPPAPRRYAEPPPPRPTESAAAVEQRRPQPKDMRIAAKPASNLGYTADDDFDDMQKQVAVERAPAPSPEPERADYRAPAAAGPLPAAAPPPKAAPASPAKRSMEKRAKLAAEGEATYAAAPVVREESSDEEEAKVEARPSLAEALRRADRLFVQRNWSAAAEAYRELLRRYPDHGDAAKWRSRIDQALLAASEENEAARKAAKAKAAERDTPQPAKP